jgi:dihydroflavonol-4-reductase
MDGMPGCPKVNSGLVDVRDVADLHLRAMTNLAANGERFPAIAGRSLWFAEVAKALRERLGNAASRVPTRRFRTRSCDLERSPIRSCAHSFCSLVWT